MQTDLVVLVLLALSVTGTAAHAPRAIPMTRTVQKRNVDKRTTPEQLSGCESVDFSVQMTIGQGSATQTFNMLVDTGSSTLAVAGSSCTVGCGNVSPLYQESTHADNGATNTQSAVSSTYGGGTSWQGYVWTDTVTLAGFTVSGMAIAVQTSADQFYRTGCAGLSSSLSNNQGILGMAYSSITVTAADGTPTDAYPSEWESTYGSSLVFAMLMCSTEGYLYMDGIPTSIPSPVYVPIVSQSYYDIHIQGLALTDSTGSTIVAPLASSVNAFNAGPMIVDSGTTQFTLPQAVYDLLSQALANDSAFTSIFGSDYLSTGNCQEVTESYNVTYLNSVLPWLRVYLDENQSLLLPPVSSYLMLTPISSGALLCPGVGVVSHGATIMGWSVLNNYLVVYDRSDAQFSGGAIGWSTTTECNSGDPILAMNAFATILAYDTVPPGGVMEGSGTNSGSGTTSLFGMPLVNAIAILVGGIVGLCVLCSVFSWCVRSSSNKRSVVVRQQGVTVVYANATPRQQVPMQRMPQQQAPRPQQANSLSPPPPYSPY